MDSTDFLHRQDDDRLAEQASSVVRAEANLLRLPFFALRTKGLNAIGGYECTGTLTRDGQTYDFVFTVEKTPSKPYPGPLARAVHQAILSIATDRGFPNFDPVPFTWRDLCRRMHIPYSGRTVGEIKTALAAITSLTITSKQALWSKKKAKPITSRREFASHLYDEIVFIDDEMPDGSQADKNYVWFSRWYLENLNSMYSVPVDYDLWRHLDKRSPIASRLYEFCLPKWHANRLLRINYTTLANYLPIKPEKHFSAAQRQLSRAQSLLVEADVLEKPRWERRKTDAIAQVHLAPGRRFDSMPAGSLVEHEVITDIKIRELPAGSDARLVKLFYQELNGRPRQPKNSELKQAQAFIEIFGEKEIETLMVLAVNRMKDQWPEGKRFGGVAGFLEDVADEQAAKQKEQQRKQREQRKRQAEHQVAVRQQLEDKQRTQQLEQQWQRSDATEQSAILDQVLDSNPFLAKRHRQDPDSSLVHSMCLEELARRQQRPKQPK